MLVLTLETILIKHKSHYKNVDFNEYSTVSKSRSSHPEMFLVKGALKICSKFTGEHPCRSVISIKLKGVLKHIFITPFTKNTSEQLLLKVTNNKQQFEWMHNLITDTCFPRSKTCNHVDKDVK